MSVREMVKIDLTYLESIAGGDQAFIRQMLEMFAASTLPEFQRIDEFYVKKDWTMVGTIAHKIKAPVQMLGQAEIVDKLVAIEKSGKEKVNLDEIPLLITEIRAKLLEVNKEVEKLIATFN